MKTFQTNYTCAHNHKHRSPALRLARKTSVGRDAGGGLSECVSVCHNANEEQGVSVGVEELK